MADDLIKKFLDAHQATEALLNQDNIAEAKQKYLDVVNIYHDIQNSQLDHFHKEIAYDNVTTLFKKINDAKKRITVPYNAIIAAILIIAFSFLVAFNPSIVGLASYTDTVTQPLDVTFAESKLYQLNLQDRPLSLALSGTTTGAAKVYLKQGEKLELVVDTAQAGSTFENICAETCDVNANSNAIELFVEVQSGELKLTSVQYKIEPRPNTPPAWQGDKTFAMTVGQANTVNMNNYFTDADNDQLVFLSTTADGLEVQVEHNTATITPASAGTYKMLFIASDRKDATRIPITITAS